MANTYRIRLLDNASTAGATVQVGDTLGAGDGPIAKLLFPVLGAALQAEFFGSPTVVKIQVFGRLDGQTWSTTPIADLKTSAGYKNGDISQFTLPAPLLDVKANLVTLTGGTGVSLYLIAYGAS
jgi:hypothetical protein